MRRRLAPLLALLAAVLLITACGDDDVVTSTPDETPAPAATDVDAGDAGDDDGDADDGDAAVPTSEPEGPVFLVSVVDGEIDGGGRHEVSLGDTVTIRVTSDVAEEVHVHGYDVLVPVAAGATATVTFVADIPGVFEVELERSHRELLQLQVS